MLIVIEIPVHGAREDKERGREQDNDWNYETKWRAAFGRIHGNSLHVRERGGKSISMVEADGELRRRLHFAGSEMLCGRAAKLCRYSEGL